MNNLKGSSELTHDITITNEQISRVEDNEIARYCWEDDQLSTRSEKRQKNAFTSSFGNTSPDAMTFRE